MVRKSLVVGLICVFIGSLTGCATPFPLLLPLPLSPSFPPPSDDGSGREHPPRR